MATKSSPEKKGLRTRTDGRKPLLVYLDEDVIKQLKKVALDQDRPAYEITEEAVQQWLSNYRSRGK